MGQARAAVKTAAADYWMSAPIAAGRSVHSTVSARWRTQEFNLDSSGALFPHAPLLFLSPRPCLLFSSLVISNHLLSYPYKCNIEGVTLLADRILSTRSAFSAVTLPSVLWHCWLSARKSIRPVKMSDEVVRGYFSGTRCKWFATTSSLASLWSPYVIEQTIIFSSCFFLLLLLLLSFFPRLISAVGDWMFTILWHMVWP